MKHSDDSENIDRFIRQVRKNCSISDANSAGLYSICGLALRLRDLYKWENRLEPWVEKDSSEILDWIGEREELWESIAGDDPGMLPFDQEAMDPFATLEINRRLAPHGLYYGAGYAFSMKPTFFLAKIHESKTVDGYSVYILGKELARDLLTLPALNQDNAILFRKDAASMYLWDQMAYLKASGRPALDFAFQHCGLPDNRPESIKAQFITILSVQMEICIYHELGEIRDTVFKRGIWQEMISEFPHTPVELLARAVKDLLADTSTHGTLPHLIETQDAAGIGLYAAFIDGLARAVFPEFREAFSRFVIEGKWEIMEEAVQTGYSKASDYAVKMMDIYHEGKQKGDVEWAGDMITEKLITPFL